MSKRPYLLAFVGIACLHLATSAKADLDTASKLKIVASNYPLAYFAERIAGTRASVTMPAPAGEDPAFWKPNQDAIGEMQKADLILLNGADYERWLARIALPRLKVVDTSASFKQNYIIIESAVTHSHGPGGMHSHAGTAFTTWLDFSQADKQADTIAEAMARKRPELRGQIMGKLAALKADLENLDTELKLVSSARPGRPLLGSHPVYQYLARRYDLNLQSVHWEPNQMPPDSEWQALASLMKTHPAQRMIWEAEPSAQIAAKLKQMGVESVVFDPCANRPGSGDFLGVMTQNLANLKLALGER